MWGLGLGAVSGALFVAPLVVWNGPAEALLVYPPGAAMGGAGIGAVLGFLVSCVLAFARPANRAEASLLAAFLSGGCVVWVAFVVPLAGLWLTVLAAMSGAIAGPRVSARPSDAAAAAGTASPGSSRAPGR